MRLSCQQLFACVYLCVYMCVCVFAGCVVCCLWFVRLPQVLTVRQPWGGREMRVCMWPTPLCLAAPLLPYSHTPHSRVHTPVTPPPSSRLLCCPARHVCALYAFHYPIDLWDLFCKLPRICSKDFSYLSTALILMSPTSWSPSSISNLFSFSSCRLQLQTNLWQFKQSQLVSAHHNCKWSNLLPHWLPACLPALPGYLLLPCIPCPKLSCPACPCPTPSFFFLFSFHCPQKKAPK